MSGSDRAGAVHEFPSRKEISKLKGGLDSAKRLERWMRVRPASIVSGKAFGQEMNEELC